MYVLRKTVGAYSTGTPVDVVGNFFRLPNGQHPNPDLVVQRRSRTVMRPNTTTSRERRRNAKAAKKALGF